MNETTKEERTVTIPLGVAELIDKVYLPTNPNKLRAAAPVLVEAVREYKRALARAYIG